MADHYVTLLCIIYILIVWSTCRIGSLHFSFVAAAVTRQRQRMILYPHKETRLCRPGYYRRSTCFIFNLPPKNSLGPLIPPFPIAYKILMVSADKNNR